jgi:hypothetical protein
MALLSFNGAILLLAPPQIQPTTPNNASFSSSISGYYAIFTTQFTQTIK